MLKWGSKVPLFGRICSVQNHRMTFLYEGRPVASVKTTTTPVKGVTVKGVPGAKSDDALPPKVGRCADLLMI